MKAKSVVRIVGIVVVLFFLLNCVLAAGNLSYGPLPWGVSKGGASSLGLPLLYIPDIFGQSPPANSTTVSLDDFTNLQSPFWNPDEEPRGGGRKAYRPEGETRGTTLAGGAPRSFAESIFIMYPNEIKKEGYKSVDDLVKVLQEGGKAAEDICLKYHKAGGVIYVTEYVGKSIVPVAVGMVPKSRMWKVGANYNVWDGEMEGWTIDDAVTYMEQQGYSREFIKEALRQLVRGSYDVDKATILSRVTDNNWDKQLPGGVSALFGFEFPDYLLANGGHIVQVQGLDSANIQTFLGSNKLSRYEVKGESDVWLTLSGEFSKNYMTPQREQALYMVRDMVNFVGLSDEAKPWGMRMPKAGQSYEPTLKGGPWIGTGPSDATCAKIWEEEYDKFRKLNPQLTDDQVKWLADQGTAVRLTRDTLDTNAKFMGSKGYQEYFGISTVPPSKKMKEYGIDVTDYPPGPMLTAFKFLLEGDSLALEFFTTGIADSSRRSEFNAKVRNKFAEGYLNYANEDIDAGGAGMILRHKDWLDWIAGIGNSEYTKSAQHILDKANNYFSSDAYKKELADMGFSNFHIPPSALHGWIVGQLELTGWKWNSASNTWEFTGLKLEPGNRPKLFDTGTGTTTTSAPPTQIVDEKEKVVDGSDTPPPQEDKFLGAVDQSLQNAKEDILKFGEKYQEYVSSLQAGENVEFDAFLNKIRELGSGPGLPVVQQLLQLPSKVFAWIPKVQSTTDQLSRRGSELRVRLQNPDLVLQRARTFLGLPSVQGRASGMTVLGSYMVPFVNLTVDNVWFAVLASVFVAMALTLIKVKKRHRRR